MLYIGIDLGTSAVKLLLADANGDINNVISKEYPISFPRSNWSEQNPSDWWNAIVEGINELTADFDKSEICGIGAGGFGESLLNVAAGVVVDEFQHALAGVERVAALGHGAVETLDDAVHGVGGGAVQVEDDELDGAHGGLPFLLVWIRLIIAYSGEEVKGGARFA